MKTMVLETTSLVRYLISKVCAMMAVSRYYVPLQVVYRIDLPVDQEERIRFFTSFPKDPLHKGSVQLRTGALIGLPSTFSYRTAEDVECSSILVAQETVDWNSSAGEDLRNSLVLSDKAKAFVIGREIYYVKSFNVHIDMLLQTCSCVLAYITGSTLNLNFLLTLRLKPWARFMVFSTVAVAWLFVYIAVDDAVHCLYDNKADRLVAKLRKIYAEGGVEYYNTVLRQNRALRTLLGSRGTKQFTHYGNVVSLWRNPTVQLTSRRDNLLKYLAEYEHQNTIVPHDAVESEPNTEV